MKGFLFSGISSGIKADGQKDLGLIFSSRPAAAAALFTRNQVVAAPVILGRERMAGGLCQAVVVNSGNANCFTGDQGLADAEETSRLAADALGISPSLVMVSSTGVIGAPLPMVCIREGIPSLTDTMAPDGQDAFAQAILTTDLTDKQVTRECRIRHQRFHIYGVAKGSGMIRPDMATMLAFICTDLDLSSSLLKTALKKGCDRSFNRITVDGDTSTNDTVLALANGMSGVSLETSDDALMFQRALDDVMRQLAKKIVKDGEGATKLARIVVRGAQTAEDAFAAAQAISHSNLVKTALFGEDPNWGRITAAAGRSGARVEPGRLDLYFGGTALVRSGQWLGSAAEKEAAEQMTADELEITLDLNLGDHEDFFWFCDFSEDYVRINADYRT